MPDKSSLPFRGFSKPESNFFRLPNEWTDITAAITSLAELKVVEYVLRHTWGFREYDIVKHITTDEFMYGRKGQHDGRMDQGTGLSNKSVIEGLNKAVEHGLLEVETDDSDKGRVRKYYKLRMIQDGSDANHHQQDGFRAGVKNLHTRLKHLHPDVKSLHSSYVKSTHRTKKDTLERYNNVSKQNDIKDDEVQYYASVLAKKLGDQKSVTFYTILCRKYDPHMLIEKAAAIIADGGAHNPAAVFTQWIKTL